MSAHRSDSRGSSAPPFYGTLWQRTDRTRINPLTASSDRALTARSATAADVQAIADAVLKTLDEDKAEAVTVIDLGGKTSLADQMIIASGRSARHVAALADHVMRKLKEVNGRRASIEGLPNADWVLIDTGDIIIHLFRPEVRDFYNLERIWGEDASDHRTPN